MRILLSDGTGLTSRQTATLLARAGHRVEALSPHPLCMCQFTRHVRHVHRVPAYGADPFGWLKAALMIAARQDIDVLFPTQEQVAVMSLAHDQLRTAGLRTAVPDFASLIQVQDKVAAFATLARLGLPQPAATVITSASQLRTVEALPVFVKLPIGTASNGVCKVSTAAQLRELCARHESAGVFAHGSVLVQQAVSGPLVMIQSVFARGQLIAFHACERIREGAGGGASHKRSIDLPHVREYISVLGSAIGWHGALSADVILSPDGPLFIDINPRIVEPVNAYRSGVDLAGALLDVARHAPSETASAGHALDLVIGRPGVQTHQLLLAVLGAAQHGGRRSDVAGQVWSAMTHRGAFRGSTEELTPLRGDPLTAVPVAIAALATGVRPASWQHFVSGSVDAYSLTPAAWAAITSKENAAPDPLPQTA